MRNKGFLLPEALLAVFAVSVMLSLTLSLGQVHRDLYRIFPDDYLHVQSESILCGQERMLHSESGISIHFNPLGNVNQARTLYFPGGAHQRRIIVELGGGRLVIPE